MTCSPPGSFLDLANLQHLVSDGAPMTGNEGFERENQLEMNPIGSMVLVYMLTFGVY